MFVCLLVFILGLFSVFVCVTLTIFGLLHFIGQLLVHSVPCCPVIWRIKMMMIKC